MKYNKLFSIKQNIPINDNIDYLKKSICRTLEELGNIYSYIVVLYEDNYVITYHICETSEYNCLNKNDVIENIVKTICEGENRKIICYGQPPLDLMIELYDPLVKKLSLEQNKRWKCMEYEDLCQICRMTIVNLYNKGYYIHKRLLRKSFENEVLQMVKKITPIEIVSMENRLEGDNDMEKIRLEDTISDDSYELENETRDVEECSKNTFNEIKEILIELMGERQFEQLFRDYANGHTTSWSRRKMQTIKAFFEKEGLTRQKFNNKYGR